MGINDDKNFDVSAMLKKIVLALVAGFITFWISGFIFYAIPIFRVNTHGPYDVFNGVGETLSYISAFIVFLVITFKK